MPSRTVRTIGCMIFLSGLLFFEGTTSHPYAALSALSLVTILSGCEINNFAGQSAKSVCYNLVAMFDLFRLWLGSVLRWFRTRRSLMLDAPVAASDVLRIHSETLMSPAFGRPSFSQTLDYARGKRLPPETTGWDSN